MNKIGKFVVEEDIDLLVLLLALAPKSAPLYFLKPDMGNQSEVIYNIALGDGICNMKESVLIAHAMSDSDTTSCLYRRSKTKALKLLCTEEFNGVRETFLNRQVNRKNLITEGRHYIAAIYGSKNCKSLNDLRYLHFIQKSRKRVNLAALPPTENAAALYISRVYHQVQMWLGNDKEPTQCGGNVKQEF